MFVYIVYLVYIIYTNYRTERRRDPRKDLRKDHAKTFEIARGLPIATRQAATSNCTDVQLRGALC